MMQRYSFSVDYASVEEKFRHFSAEKRKNSDEIILEFRKNSEKESNHGPMWGAVVAVGIREWI